MQQRRLRLGDILDDYCPRERRITNHAVVAMIEDEVKQTRCTTCDADHEYRQAKVPLSRKRKRDESPLPDVADASAEVSLDSGEMPSDQDDALAAQEESFDDSPDTTYDPDTLTASSPAEAGHYKEPDEAGDYEEPDATEDEGPVHRRLIRATLPRPEGQSPERKAPDFTVRQPGGRFDQHRGGQGQGQGQGQRSRNRSGRHAQKQAGGSTRFGGPRQGNGSGSSGSSQGQQHGNRFGNASGQRGGRPQGQNRGQRQGGGQGRKRGR